MAKRKGTKTTRSRSSSLPRATRSSGNSRQKDAIALLKEDHQKVRKLLKRLEKVAGEDARQGEDLLRQLESEIKVHSQIEEEIFYPAFRDAVRGKEEALKLYFEATEEHHVVDMVMPEAKEERAGTPEFAAKAKVLKDLIEHHAEEEETEMFPKARKAIGTTALRELGSRLARRKQELRGEQR
jgi:hemerythrin-like domain-containing protein